MGNLEIIRQDKDPQRFDGLMSQAQLCPPSFELPLSDIGKMYYGAVFRATRRETSFIIAGADKALIVIQCDLTNGTLGRFLAPIEIRKCETLLPERERKAISLVFQELSDIAADAAQVPR